MLIWLNSPLPRWNRFIFLDRDGVINADRTDFIKSPGEFQFYEDSLQALRWLKKMEIHPIIISNQSGLGRKIITVPDFWDIHQHMRDTIEKNGGELLAAFYCHHHPQDGCSCRKPSPGLILAASDLYKIDLNKTPFIGDRSSDLEAARRAGCRGCLLDRPHDTSQGVGHAAAVSSKANVFGPATMMEMVRILYS